MNIEELMIILSQLLNIKDFKVFDTIAEIARQDTHIPDLEVFFNSYKKMKDNEFLTFTVPNFPLHESAYYIFIKEIFNEIGKNEAFRKTENYNNPNYDWEYNICLLYIFAFRKV